ncbi:hypothetical protein D3C78_1489920 [compost metagenome]
MITAMDTPPAVIHTQGAPLLNQDLRFCSLLFTDIYLPSSQSDAYFLRRRVRINSARVFITKVKDSSTSAARNSTR